ncbi:MAG: hypothetical protein K9H16_08980 [Bacteroidales bacterium]|nr:hypothetical protein [Bacteroidales bacterium]
MRTQTFLLALIMLIFGSHAVFAQQPQKSQRTKTQMMDQKPASSVIDLSSSSSGRYAEDQLPGTRGTAYLNPEFVEGVIAYKNGNQIDGKLLRYNLYTQQMQFIEGVDTLALGNPGEIEYIRMNEKLFVYTEYLCNGKHKSGYFELLQNGSCRLLKRWSALYHEVDETESYAGNEDCFYRDCQCFLQFFMNPASPVQIKKNDFIKSFANNSKDVKNYIKEEGLKPKNEEDLVQIIDFYNRLP